MNPTSWRLAGSAVAWMLAMLPCFVQAGSQQTAPPASSTSEPYILPGTAVSAALRIHPLVLAAQVDLERARGEAAQVGLLLHNPQVSASTSVDGRRSSGGVSQPLSWTGEGVAARRTAEASVEAARLRLHRARLEAAAECRRAYIEAIVRTRQVDIAVEGRGLAIQLRDAVSRQLDVGEASTLDLRLAELALVQASSRLLEARLSEAVALRQLSALSGVPLDRASLVTDPKEATPGGPPVDPLAGERSDLQARRAAVQQATSHRTRLRASTLAPIGVGVGLSVEDGERFVGPTIQATLPLFDRNQAGRWAADAAVTQARAAEQRLAARVHAEQSTARVRVKEALELAEHGLEDPLAEARAALASIGSGYRAGEIDLPSAILLQKEVLTGESAAMTLLGGIALAHIDLLLANDDERLVDGALRGGTP